MIHPTKEALQKQSLEFLRDNIIAVLSTVSHDSVPQAASMYYSIEEDFTFSFLALEESQKVRNIRANPRACFVVGFGPDAVTVQGGGRAEILGYPSSEVIMQMLERVKSKQIYRWPIAELEGRGNFVHIRIKPEWMVLLNLEDAEEEMGQAQDFYSILP